MDLGPHFSKRMLEVGVKEMSFHAPPSLMMTGPTWINRFLSPVEKGSLCPSSKTYFCRRERQVQAGPEKINQIADPDLFDIFVLQGNLQMEFSHSYLPLNQFGSSRASVFPSA